MHALRGQIVLPADDPAIHRVAAADTEHAFDVLVAEVIGLDLRQAGIGGGVGRDHRRLDIGARFLDRIHRPVDTRLQVELARRCDKDRDLAGADELDDTLAHHLAEQEQILADIGEALIAVRVGIVAEHRYAGGERILDRAIEAPRIDEADRDRVGLAGDRGVERVDHLRHIRGLRPGPLIVDAEQRTGILGTVLARDEERVRRHVIDEDELPARMRREWSGLRRPRSPHNSQQRPRHQPRGDAAHKGAARQCRRDRSGDVA